MKHYKISGIIGFVAVLIYALLETKTALRISDGFGSPEFISEIKIVIFKTLFFLIPASVLIFKKFKTQANWTVWLYPVVLIISFLLLYMAKDPLAAGLPMLLLVFPFCIIFAIYYLMKK